MPVTVTTGLISATAATPINSRPRTVMATEMFRAWATGLARFSGAKLRADRLRIQPLVQSYPGVGGGANVDSSQERMA
jgi:hypothetical protein